MTLLRPLAVLTAAAVLGACDLTKGIDLEDTDAGLALVPVEGGGGGGLVARPTVQFARNAGFSMELSSVRGDICGGPQLIPTGDGGTPTGILFLDAGNTLTWQEGQTTTDLIKLTNGNVITYTHAPAAGIPVTPAALVTITTPGASGGFTAMSITGRLAEPLTGLGPINPSPGAGQGLALTWTATTTAADSAKVEFRIQYSTLGQSPNEEVICRVDDDGAFTVPDGSLFGWRNATPESRRVIASRYRSTIRSQGDSQFGFISTASITKTTFP